MSGAESVPSHPSPADDTRDVYAAEDLVAAWLDDAARRPGEPVRVRVGSQVRTFEPEVEPRFTDPEHVQPYVDRVLEHLRRAGASYPGPGGDDRAAVPVVVRGRRGATRAHYEHSGSPTAAGVVALPPREIGGAWSLRALVVLHEVAHHLCGAPGHGRDFRTTFLRLLEDLGLPVTAELLHTAYRQIGLDTGVDGEDRTLLRIGRLLRQAERSANLAERDAYLAKAQSLATRHQIALAVARAAAAGEERREEPAWETVPIGESGKRSLARYVRLMLEIARANDVRVAIYTSNTRVTLYGFPSDIAIVKALYASLVTQMVSDGDDHLRSGAHRSDVRTAWDSRRARWVEQPVHGSTARAAFYEAWAEHVGARLSRARREAHARARDDDARAARDDGSSRSNTSTEVALRAKEVEVVDYFGRMQREHGVRGTWRGAARAGNAAPTSSAAGVRAASRARLGGERGLPPGRGD